MTNDGGRADLQPQNADEAGGKAKARLAEIDIIISNIYEDKALGRIAEHRCLAMTEKYDTESKKTAKRD